MVYRALIMLVLLFSISGCVFASHKIKGKFDGPVPMADIYANSAGEAHKDVAKFIEANLKEQKTFGYVKPYIPVVQGPVVRKVWVPDHKSEQDGAVLVGGHWVYLMIEGPRWFVETEIPDAHLPILVPGAPHGHAN